MWNSRPIAKPLPHCSNICCAAHKEQGSLSPFFRQLTQGVRSAVQYSQRGAGLGAKKGPQGQALRPKAREETPQEGAASHKQEAGQLYAGAKFPVSEVFALGGRKGGRFPSSR